MLKHELLTLIEQKRAELISVVSKNGLSSSAAIRHSQELDELLNKYNNIFIKKIPSHTH
ncbi:aspartyl-phosphate phosphatase Spo0E family protein [Bacillus sp. DNRA2]|uniref:aspartyl-phosphate phosphatase Spo0E family protein n=1 Tax=Bacillus sp. DNRA2 TaxID=2723053 RepID=UPI00145EE88A|nr:aspartyl-phosphate phosphatase Spo0E family protein [Bacillus sp. DNRA2]NMD69587.1 aspartyl-phosphate phosphatase Spo0E family protein [Bacillus sp. DNRA2]